MGEVEGLASHREEGSAVPSRGSDTCQKSSNKTNWAHIRENTSSCTG